MRTEAGCLHYHLLSPLLYTWGLITHHSDLEEKSRSLRRNFLLIKCNLLLFTAPFTTVGQGASFTSERWCPNPLFRVPAGLHLTLRQGWIHLDGMPGVGEEKAREVGKLHRESQWNVKLSKHSEYSGNTKQLKSNKVWIGCLSPQKSGNGIRWMTCKTSRT